MDSQTDFWLPQVDRREFLGLGGPLLRAATTAESADADSLPAGVSAVWDLEKAQREKTATRARVCLNGLWRWQPATTSADSVPADGWGYFKVPGFWPGKSNYIQEDCQTLFAHPKWRDDDLRGISAAWYQRELTIPEGWSGRRIILAAEYVNSLAVAYVDGNKVGVIRFPAGELDITPACRFSGKHVLSLLVMALPLNAVLLSYSDTNSVREVKGSVERRGLCGDVYLASMPATERITNVKIDTSVRKGELSVSAAFDGLVAGGKYALRVRIEGEGREVHDYTDKPFSASDVKGGHFAAAERWKPTKLWDVHTPENKLTAHVSLVDVAGKVLDDFHPVRFGFREFWIDGRDFYLNGSRIYLSAVPLDNAQISARTASYEGTMETLKRLKSFGINFVYTHNYGCQPGSHISFAEVLRAADDAGMLVAMSQPHFSHYDWKAADAESANGYARHAEFYVRVAQNHPSVVAYSMSHNATGYDEDMNPDLIDGLKDPHSDGWSRNNAKLALRAEAIVTALDSGRIVYHHSSGNLGSMHTANFYLNFVPVQEVSDWFEHWATKGVKPVFLCEYGVPFTWDWTMYRGWYRSQREWGSAKVPWEFCLAEWNAQFLGDRAYQIGEAEKRNLRWEAKQFRTNDGWHRWDYPHPVGSSEFDDRQEVLARYITDNWRAHRTWGVSANSPWEYAAYWKPSASVDRRRRDLKVDWDHLQRPGFSPDFVPPRQGWMSVDGALADWIPTAAANALIRNNRPLLAYLGGKPGDFTSKSHNFFPGETVQKQLVIVNNSRETVTCGCEVLFPGISERPSTSSRNITVQTGNQERIPVRVELPATLAAGKYELNAAIDFGKLEPQTDTFLIDVLPRPADVAQRGKIALFDPKGETGKLLAGLGVRFQQVEASADLSRFDVLIIGKQALTPGGPGPDLDRVRDGLKVVVFEQAASVLERRFGFRVAEYGLRQVFKRVPDHPLLAGLDADHLHDWRGAAALLPPRLEYTLRPRYGPTVRWCGIETTRAWRAGCRGNVASVLIEKPARSDFLPVLDGGYALQYSPLLEYRESRGMVLFCQVDVTGRSESDPAADTLVRNILRYVSNWKPSARRKAIYVGDPAGKKHLESTGLSLTAYAKDQLATGCALIVSSGGGKVLAANVAAIEKWLQQGGHLLALGLEREELNSFLPFKVATKRQEHVAAYFEPPPINSPLVGIGPADVHNRDPREIPLVVSGAKVFGNGVLAHAENANVVFCQLVPWQFDSKGRMNLKRTFRRASCLVTRLAANMGAAGATPLLARFRNPVAASKNEKRCLDGLYLDSPEEWDDPYRYFRW